MGGPKAEVEQLENAPHSDSRRGSATSEHGGHGVRNVDYVDHRDGDDRAEEAKGRDAAAFNGKYWYSANFIGTLLAIGFSFMAGIGGYGLIAPVLSEINADIGPCE